MTNKEAVAILSRFYNVETLQAETRQALYLAIQALNSMDFVDDMADEISRLKKAETYCTCWVDYPNASHKKANGSWKCKDRYTCIRQRTGSSAYTGLKTKCVKKEGGTDEKG